MDLPQDVIFKILLKLPVRSLLRFKCVCKDWRGLIESSLFKDKYLALRRAKAMDDEVVGLKLKRYEFGIYKSFVTCWYEDYEPLALSASAPSSSSSSSNDVEISGNPRSGPSTIINHFNGIVCVKGGNRGNYWEDNMRVNWFDITLVNPALREFRKLPVLYLGGDYECYVRNIGFGYDDASNDYKVFAIVSVADLGYEKIGLVYHLSTNSWRILGNMSEFVFHNYMTVDGEFILCMTDDTVFSHGSIHCIMRSDPNYRLLAFNLTTESFQEMLFPRGWSYDDQTTATRLLTIDKSTIALAAFTLAISAVIHVLDIWVMKEYGDTESWTKLYSISSLPRFVRPLSFWRKDKLLLQTVDSRLICYDLFTGQVYEYEECDPIVGSYDHLSSKGQQQEDEPPGQCDDLICGPMGWGLEFVACRPLGWGLEFVTGHESFVSLKQV